MGKFTIKKTLAFLMVVFFVATATTASVSAQSPPRAFFSGSLCTIKFTDQSAGSPTAWDWDFGDGSPHSTLKNPTHTYSERGGHSVTLTVSNDAGSDSVTFTV